MTSESNAFTLAQSAFEAVCKERDKVQEDAINYFARIGELEKERDEAREQLDAMRDELQKVCQQRDAWAMRCDKLGVAAMCEAIKELFNSFANEPKSDSAWLLNDRQINALAKLQPFIKPKP